MATVHSLLADALPCLWGAIGLSFMATAPTNWHATLLNEDCQKDVPIERDDVKRGASAAKDACTRPGPARVSAALALRSKRGGMVDDARDARALETLELPK